VIWDTKKPRFLIDPTADIPAQDRSKIMDTLAKRKIPMTDENILKLYNLTKGSMK